MQRMPQGLPESIIASQRFGERANWSWAFPAKLRSFSLAVRCKRNCSGFLIVLNVLFFSVICLAGCSGQEDTPLSELSDPSNHELVTAGSLSISETDLDVGSHWFEDDVEWTFLLTNHGRSPVDVEKIVASCSCTGITPASFSLDSDESISLTASINLQRAIGRLSLAAPFGVELRFVTNRNLIQEFYLSGEVKRPFVVEDLLTFTRLIRPGELPDPLTVPVRTHPEIEELSIASDGDQLLVSHADDKTWSIQLRPSQRLGSFLHPLHISAFCNSDSPPVESEIRVRGFVDGGFDWLPGELVLATSSQDPQTVSESFEITSRDGAEFQIVSIQSSGLELQSHCQTSDMPASQHRIIGLLASENMPVTSKSGSLLVEITTAEYELPLEISIPVTFVRFAEPDNSIAMKTASGDRHE